MADQGQQEEGARSRRSRVVGWLSKQRRRGWEHTKMLLAALLVMATNPLFLTLFFAYLMFYFGMQAYRELDGDPSAFAIYATLTLTNIVAVVIEVRNLYRRWTR